jgi:hypothetical protein
MADTPKPDGGRRKDGQSFKAGNIREDGSYDVGKNRPPPQHQFSANDGRTRGRRVKGVPNADTEFAQELARKIVVRETGKPPRKVTKSRAIDMRLIENAMTKGQNPAIEMVDKRRQRIREKSETTSLYNGESDQQILKAWFEQQLAITGIDPATYGDPAPPGEEGGSDLGETGHDD